MPSMEREYSSSVGSKASETEGEARKHEPLPPMLDEASARLGAAVVRRKIADRIARRQAAEQGPEPGADSRAARAASSSGAPLPAALQQKFGSSLGADLSAVRVHTGAESEAAA